MGILDIDPEVSAMMQQYGAISPEAKTKARNDALMNAGFAMLASNGMGRTNRESFGRSVGAGGLAGVNSYNQSLEDAQRQQYAQMQMAGALEKVRQQKLRQQMMEQFRNGLPEQDRQLFDVAPDEYIKNHPQFQKPQLVEVADPKEPLRTQKVWMKPGQTEGTVAGYGQMPESLDPRIIEGRMRVAAAGKPSIENKIYNTAETEQSKVWGKTLGEVRSNFANAAFTAPSKIAKLDRMEELLKGVDGGKLAPLGLEIASAANSLGFKIDPKLGNKQAAESLAREMAAEFRQPGTGPMTDKDFDNFMKRVPDLSKTAEGRAQIFKTMRSATARDIGAHKIISGYAKRRNGNIDDGVIDELSDFYSKNPVTGQGSGGWSATKKE